jgi:azurin
VKLTSLTLLTLACVLGSCSPGRETPPPKKIEMTGDDETKFNVTSFEVRPGQKVALTLKNIGELPKEAMSHNWVLLERGTDAARVVQTGFEHPESDYITAEYSRRVVAKTKLLGPGESDSVTFTAPYDPGAYEYICTFPEHFGRGMKGTMMVVP